MCQAGKGGDERGENIPTVLTRHRQQWVGDIGMAGIGGMGLDMLSLFSSLTVYPASVPMGTILIFPLV